MKAGDALAEDAIFRAGFAVWREIGYLPSIADRHTTENWPWFLASDPGDLPFGIKRSTISDRTEWRKRWKARVVNYAQTGDVETLGHMGHGDDPVGRIIESLEGHGSFLYGSNYTNQGQIQELSAGAVVETRCLFDASGVHPLSSPMPNVLRILTLPHVLRQEAIIDIALHGSFDELVALIMTDPLCCRLKMGVCRQMVREMLEANRSYIQNPRLLMF